MKLFKKSICLFIIVLLLFFFCKIQLLSKEVEKYIIDIDEKQDFCLDSVCILFQDKLSIIEKDFNVSDFEEVAVDSIYDNNIYLIKKIRNGIASGLIKCEDDVKNIYRDMTLKWNEPKTKSEIIEIIKVLEKRDDVYSVSPNYIYEFQSQNVNNLINSSGQSVEDYLNLPSVHNITIGSKNIIVGVIDTGISASNIDIYPNIDNNLHKDFTNPNNEQPLVDSVDHGTHVAYTLGAASINNYGSCGVCNKVSMVSLKISNNNKAPSDLARQAINYAESCNIPILNFSACTKDANDCPYNDYYLYLAIQGYSGLFICGAGNDGKDNDQTPQYPASYNLSNIISVGGLNIDDILLRYSEHGHTTKSNYGENSVDIYTIGYYPCYNGNSIFNHAGTSFSSPVVAATAALLLSIDNSLDASQLKQLIIDNCDDFSLYKINEHTNYGDDPLIYLYEAKKLNIFESIIDLLSDFQPHIIQNTSYNYFSQSFILSNNNYNYSHQKFFKLSAIDAGLYSFRVYNTFDVSLKIFDSNLNELTINNCNSIDQLHVYKNFTVGIYYIKIETTSTTSNNIILTIDRTISSNLQYNTINSYSLDDIEEINICYTNYCASGYYYLLLSPIDPLGGTLSEVPPYMMEVYSESERQNTLNYLYINNVSIYCYLEYGSTYYFDIETNLGDLRGFEIFIVNTM